VDDVVVFGLEVPVRASRATSFRDRLVGVRSRLSQDSLILRTWTIHTFGLRSPLAVVALDADLRVMASRLVAPGRMAFFRGARFVLELPGDRPLPSPGTQVTVRDV
jgi:hypothetical protein